jgi:hypothetical protein
MTAIARVAVSAALTVAAGGCAPGASTTPPSGAQMAADVINPYLKIQAALAQDSAEGLRINATALATAAARLGPPAVKIRSSALQLAPADELNDARMKFLVVSQALVAYMTGLGLAPPDGVRIAVCPETDKTWLQEGTDISSPYEGSAGTCGEFR